MRNFFWLFLAVLSLGITACGEDDEPTTNEQGIIGTWKITGIDYSGTSTTTVQGIPPTTATFTGTGYDMNLSITFGENPNNYVTSGDYSIELVTMAAGQTFTNQWTNQGFLGNGTWERNGDTLTATDSGGDVGVATIVSESDNEIVFNVMTQETTTDQGVTTVYDIDGTYVFTRE